MRKLSLLAAAAMVAGGSAFAMDGGGVSISGEANFGVKFAESDDDSKSELQFHHEFKVTFAASGTTDGGIGFGGKMTLDNTESVTSGKVTPAKTGYIVTADDLDAAGLKRLAARFGFSPVGLKEGDIIVSGSKTNFSGFEQVKSADIPGHFETKPRSATVGDTIFLNTGTTFTRAADDSSPTTFTVVTAVAAAGGAEITEDAEFTTGNVLTINAAGDTLTVVADQDAFDALSAEAQATSIIAANANARYRILNAGHTYTVTESTRISDQDVINARSQAYIDGLSASVAASDKQKVNNHGEVYISMDMHKLTIGSDLDAADKLAGGLADPGFDGIGIDDVAEGVYGKSAKQVRYDGDFGVASVAISYGDNAGDAAWAAGFSFNVEPVTFGAGFDSLGVMSIGMGFTQGQISMNALYSTDSDHDEADNEAIADVAKARIKDSADYNAKIGGLNNASKVGNKPDLKNQAIGVDVSYKMNETTSVVLVAAQHKKESARWSQAWTGTTVGTGADTDLKRAPADDKWVTTSTTVDA
ncbi:MAG: hypothetical protein OXC53_12895, partial [Rhodobacteraceae bacterium]|nr:hypothetical protein [Paracoccaceae bacterium]